MVCPICNSSNFKNIYHTRLPFSSAVLSNTVHEKIAKGSFSLVFCEECNFVFNNSFDRRSIDKYYSSDNYVVKNILPGNMSKNIQYIFKEILKRSSKKAVAIEIGSGRGDFAVNLSTQFEQVYTIDPSVVSLEKTKKNIKHFNTFFDYKLLDKIKIPDLIVARHLLEHLENPIKFVQEIDNFITNDDCLVYIEIPNFDEIVSSSRFYDLFYDHYGYYYQNTFQKMLEKTNLEVIDTIEMFSSQHIGYFCKRNSNKEASFKPNLVNSNFQLEEQKNKLNKFLEQYESFIVWGAGAHGLTLFYNLDQTNQNKISCFIDNGVSKQGKFIPGTSIEIKNDEIIKDNKKHVILISAALYEKEIREHILKSNDKAIIVIPSSFELL